MSASPDQLRSTEQPTLNIRPPDEGPTIEVRDESGKAVSPESLKQEKIAAAEKKLLEDRAIASHLRAEDEAATLSALSRIQEALGVAITGPKPEKEVIKSKNAVTITAETLAEAAEYRKIEIARREAATETGESLAVTPGAEEVKLGRASELPPASPEASVPDITESDLENAFASVTKPEGTKAFTDRTRAALRMRQSRGASPATPTPEKGPEKLPTEAEVVAVLERLSGGRAHKMLRSKSDEKGLTVYEIESTDASGERIEYQFQMATYDYRDPSIPSTTRFSASIHTVEFSGDMPCGGGCVANYLDGEWTHVE